MKKTVSEIRDIILRDAIVGDLVINGIFKWKIETYDDLNRIVSDLIDRGLNILSVQIVLE